MHFIKNYLAFILIISFLVLPCQILAADNANELETILEDEIVTADDLGVSEPDVLPGDALYPFKDMWRGFRVAITFNKVKKAELKLHDANERIIEAKILAEKEGNEESEENFKKALEKYEKDLEKVEKIISNIDEKAEDNPKLDKFINKLASSQIKQQKLIQKLEDKVPETALNNIKKARQNATKHFAKVISQVVPQGQIAYVIEKAIEAQKGSKFKDFKNLEILKQIREDLPEDSKKHFIKAEKKILDKLVKKLEKLNDKERKELKKYFKKINGSDEIIKELDEARNKTTKKFKGNEKTKNTLPQQDLPGSNNEGGEENTKARMEILQKYTDNLTPERRAELEERTNQQKITEPNPIKIIKEAQAIEKVEEKRPIEDIIQERREDIEKAREKDQLYR